MGMCGSSEKKSSPIILEREEDKQKLTFKVVVLGDVFVGKTSILSYLKGITD